MVVQEWNPQVGLNPDLSRCQDLGDIFDDSLSEPAIWLSSIIYSMIKKLTSSEISCCPSSTSSSLHPPASVGSGIPLFPHDGDLEQQTQSFLALLAQPALASYRKCRQFIHSFMLIQALCVMIAKDEARHTEVVLHDTLDENTKGINQYLCKMQNLLKMHLDKQFSHKDGDERLNKSDESSSNSHISPLFLFNSLKACCSQTDLKAMETTPGIVIDGDPSRLPSR